MRTLIATAAAGLAVAAGAGVALAAPGTGNASTSTTMRLTGHQVSDKTIDVGRKGFSVGDDDLSMARLTEAGDQVASFDSACQVVFVSKGAAHELCRQTFTFAKGTIESSGEVTSSRSGPAPFDWAVTGGTGTYRNARGFVHVVPGNRTVQLIVHVTD